MKGRRLVLVLFAASGLAGPSTGRAQLGPVGPQFQVNVWTTGSQYRPSVGRDGAGNFVVVWSGVGSAGSDTDAGSIQARRYDGAGNALGGEFQVNTWTTGTQTHPAVACDAAGSFVVAWSSVGSAGSDTDANSIQARRYDTAGTPLGAEFQVNVYTTGYQSRAAVASHGGTGFVVVWSSHVGAGTGNFYSSIQGRRYDAAGTPLGGEFQVNTYTSGFQGAPAVAADAAGSVVAWEGLGGGTDPGSSVQARRYDAAGTPLGPQFQVNEGTAGEQRRPAVASDGAGNLVVAWESTYTETDGHPVIEARRFDAAGTPLGPDFQVNTSTNFIQTAPAVATDASGNFLVVWSSFAGSSLPAFTFTVQGQRYDVAGAPLGGEFQVNALGFAVDALGEATTDSAVANAAGADFVVLWTGFVSGGADADGTSIQGQLLSPSAPTTTVTSTSSTSSSTLAPALVPGRRLVVNHSSVRFEARPAPNEDFPLPAADPTVVGGAFRIFDTMLGGGNTNTDIALPPSGWEGLGRPAGTRGWRYRGEVTPDDPCRIVLVKPRMLKVLCRGAGLSLSTQFADDAGVVLSLGATDRYCATFGGLHVREDVFALIRKRAPAPVSCPTPFGFQATR